MYYLQTGTGVLIRIYYRLNKLPYENKVVFTNKKYPEIKSSVYIPGFEKEKSVGNCFEYISLFSGKKRYDIFDYVTWFNRGKYIGFFLEKTMYLKMDKKYYLRP